MVSREPVRRHKSESSLDRIRLLAGSEKNVIFASDRVTTTTTNLGYSLLDVCLCLRALTDAHYSESLLYPDTKAWLDVYLITWSKPNSSFTDSLYIKLKLDRNCMNIIIMSFHLEGAL